MRRNRQNRWDEFLHWVGYSKHTERYNNYIVIGFGLLLSLIAVVAFVSVWYNIGLIFKNATYT